MFEIKEIVNDQKNNFKSYEIITNNQKIVGSFYAYDNQSHLANKYLVINDNLITKEEVFSYIKLYFNKPLQVMIDSTNVNIINTLLNANFKLVRKCYELEVFKRDLLSRKYQEVSFLKTNKNEKYL